MNRFLFLPIFCLLATFATAQKDWQSLKKEAESADKKGEFGEAGNLYMDAYRQKEKSELLEKAVDCFRKGHEYGGLAGALEIFKNSSRDKKIGYEYANALKQSGKYTDAIREFQLFINNYRGGKDYDVEEKRVNTQIQGCNLAIKLQKTPVKQAAPERVAKLCSTQNEAAPCLNSPTELYFTSAVDGSKAKIFRSERGSAGWQKPNLAFQFKGFEQNVGNITICNESKRMYFTQFTIDKKGAVNSQIYGSEQKNGEWTTPVKLPDFINAKEATATHPCAVVANGKEQLFFVSDRKGGQGGLDIWVASRNLQSDGFAFTLPINLGPGVNTAADEITPFRLANDLFFSSNGLTSIGGFDIFKATKKGEDWGFAENIGIPLNSPADDMYYTPTAEGTFFLVSNRLVKGQKAWYKDDDIFTNGNAATAAPLAVATAQIVGTVTDIAKSAATLPNVKVSLIDITNGGREIATKTTKDGRFTFEVKPQMEYRVEAQKEGYRLAKLEVTTTDFTEPKEFPARLEMTRLADYKGNEGKIGEHEPLDELKPIADETAPATPDDARARAIASSNPPTAPAASEIKQILDETVDFNDLTAAQKDDVITLNGIEVIQVDNGYKPVIRTKKTPVSAVAAVKKGEVAGKKPTKKEDDGDASNDENGTGMNPTGDTKEGTPEPVEKTPPKKVPSMAMPNTPASTATAAVGLTQKVQLAAETPNKYAKSKYDFLTKLGATLQTEPGPNGVERILAVPTDGDTKALLKKIQAMPAYKGAFIAKYKNGVRM